MPVQKILVVDDSPTDRQYMIETLSKKGYQIVTAENGEDAVVKAKTELPDLILMDVVMPGLNGYQATRSITRDDATKHIPVIMCTTKGAGHRQDLGHAAGRHRLPGQAGRRAAAAREDRGAEVTTGRADRPWPDASACASSSRISSVA